MSGLFGVVSQENCRKLLFYGVDYHSHLGTERGGLAILDREKAMMHRKTPLHADMVLGLSTFIHIPKIWFK